MGVQEHRHTIPALIEKVEEACEFVSTVAKSAGMDEEAVYRCYLSVEEVCTNIIEHGYHYDDGQNVIEIVCRPHADHITITIIDDAAPFNPLDRGDPDPSTPLMDRDRGGWGIYFVKQYMDRVSYSYEGERNQLTLEKRL
jgi:serine/threonine-protein kinase RsbW